MEAFVPLIVALVEGNSIGAAFATLSVEQWVNIGLALASDIVAPVVKQDFVTFMSKLGKGATVKEAATDTVFDAVLARNDDAAIRIQGNKMSE